MSWPGDGDKVKGVADKTEYTVTICRHGDGDKVNQNRAGFLEIVEGVAAFLLWPELLDHELGPVRAWCQR